MYRRSREWLEGDWEGENSILVAKAGFKTPGMIVDFRTLPSSFEPPFLRTNAYSTSKLHHGQQWRK